MEIGKYISQALKIHPTIYVEQLGVFRKVHRPSTYDKDRQVYLPPLDYVEFDSLDQEGFSLTTFVQQSDNIQKTEAKALVGQAVENLRTVAEEDGEVYLDTLGHLVQYGNALIFKPQDLTGFALEPIPYISEDDTEDPKADEDNDQELEEPTAAVEEEPVSQEVGTSAETVEPTIVDEPTDPQPDDPEATEEINEVPEPRVGVVTDHPLSELSKDTTADEKGSEPATEPQSPKISAEVHTDPQEVEPVGIFNAEEAVPEETSADEPVQTLSEEGSTWVDESDNTSQPATRNPQLQEEVVENPKRGRGIWFFILALLALIIIGGLWYYNNHMVQKENEDTSASDDGLTERPMIIPTDTSRTEDADIFSADPSDTTSQMGTSETPAQETPEVALPANHRWYIVIGAHRSHSQAEDEVERYRRQGHPRVQMLPKSPSDTFIRVIWDSYVTKQEADSALRYVQQNHVPDAWHRERKNFN